MPPFPAPVWQFVNEVVNELPCIQVTFYMTLSSKHFWRDLTGQHGLNFLLDSCLDNKSKIQIAASETFSGGLRQMYCGGRSYIFHVIQPWN